MTAEVVVCSCAKRNRPQIFAPGSRTVDEEVTSETRPGAGRRLVNKGPTPPGSRTIESIADVIAIDGKKSGKPTTTASASEVSVGLDEGVSSTATQ